MGHPRIQLAAMPDLTWLIDRLSKEGAVISNAPFTFLFILLLSLAIAFLLVRWQFKDIIENKNALIASLKDNRTPSSMSLVMGEDRKAIDQVVRVVDYSVGNAGIFALDAPHLNFGFRVFNGSVFEINLDHRVEGHVKYSGKMLAGRLEMLPDDQNVKNLKHGKEGSFGVRLWLDNPADAEVIRLDHQLRDFDFRLLVIMIVGEDFISKPVSFSTLH